MRAHGSGVLEEMAEDIRDFPAENAGGGGAHALGRDIGRVGAPRARCCGMREVTSGAAAGAFGDGTAGEDMETAEAAERLRTGRWGYRSCKRAFDIVFSLVVLVFLSWLYLIIAIAIKLDDPKGPVIFAQTRVGKDGREFRMYKFRSMVADAETRLAQLLERNEKTGPVFKMAHDPRVTRVGRILRKVSLASVIIGTPGDGESTKSLSRSANSSLDLQLCERRPELCFADNIHYMPFEFLSVGGFRVTLRALKRTALIRRSVFGECRMRIVSFVERRLPLSRSEVIV